jgi:hypothetical protein
VPTHDIPHLLRLIGKIKTLAAVVRLDEVGFQEALLEEADSLGPLVLEIQGIDPDGDVALPALLHATERFIGYLHDAYVAIRDYAMTGGENLRGGTGLRA